VRGVVVVLRRAGCHRLPPRCLPGRRPGLNTPLGYTACGELSGEGRIAHLPAAGPGAGGTIVAMSSHARPAIAVIGGSGFYDFFDDEAVAVEVDTPYGAPSAPVAIGEVEGRPVAFLPRHGKRHE